VTKAETKTARTQEVVLRVLLDHERNGELPTTLRFVFYELEQRGEVVKPDPDDKRPNRRRSIGWPPGAQDVTDALTELRETGAVALGARRSGWVPGPRRLRRPPRLLRGVVVVSRDEDRLLAEVLRRASEPLSGEPDETLEREARR
jgi:hypothetical protein